MSNPCKALIRTLIPPGKTLSDPECSTIGRFVFETEKGKIGIDFLDFKEIKRFSPDGIRDGIEFNMFGFDSESFLYEWRALGVSVEELTPKFLSEHFLTSINADAYATEEFFQRGIEKIELEFHSMYIYDEDGTEYRVHTKESLLKETFKRGR